jgi:XTP/dITP diphosphohydrolase
VTRLLVGTTNADKVCEIREVMAATGVTLLGLADLPPVEEPEETGETFTENARQKALYYARHAGMPTVAEDSGLVIDALDGAPGIYSARFVRPDASYPERFAEIHRRLAGRPRPHAARFVCAVCVVDGGEVVYEGTSRVEGEIAPAPRGGAGFGYDPIFFYPPYGRTLAEVSPAEKLAVAHRGQAFRALAAWLRDRPLPDHPRAG